MGQDKSKFDEEDVQMAGFARALALPVRISIIKKLLLNEWVSVAEFHELPLIPDVLNKHLNALKAAGLVIRMSKNGINFYKLNMDNFKTCSATFEALLHSA